MEAGRLEVLTKLIGENRKQVEWAKNLDFKATYTCLLFVLISLSWILSRDKLDTSPWLLISAFWLVPLTGVLILVRNHFRHSGLNEQWKRIARALELDKNGIYGVEPVMKLRTHDLPFHIGRILYLIPLLLIPIIATLIIRDKFDSAIPKETKAMNYLADEERITRKVEEYVRGHNAGDAKVAASIYALDGSMTYATGVTERSRGAIEDRLTELFAGPWNDTHLKLDINTIRFLRPDVAVEDETFEVSGLRGEDGIERPALRGRTFIVWVKQNGEWFVAAGQGMVPVGDQ